MSERWRDRVDAAVDAYKEGCYALSEGTSRHDDATYAAARDALLALVTDGRCPECGSDSVWHSDAIKCTAARQTRPDRAKRKE